jgi:hypothetical protein
MVVVAANLMGCVSIKAYWVDRGRDAADIITLASGVGAGAKARVGPFQLGFFANSDLAGIRNGLPFALEEMGHQTIEIVSPIPIPSSSCKIQEWLTAADCFRPGERSSKRGKEYEAIGLWVPFIVYTDKPGYYTQIEVALGVGGTFRLGLNPGELLDYIFGWVGIDIYGDDIEAKKAEEQSNKIQKAMDKSKPGTTPFAPQGNDPTASGIK